MPDSLLAKYGTSRNGHAIFSPSGSYGWLNCPGYLLANAVAEDTAGYDAAYGTVAHAVAQEWLTTAIRPGSGQVQRVSGFEVVVDEDMLDHLQRYVDWCEEVTSDGDVYIERWVDISRWMPIPEQGGTADHFVCKMGHLIITDLKMGIGVPVYVENNPQAMLYALGVFDEWDFIYHFDRITIRICQPRRDYFGVWECSREDLLAFGEYVRERAAAAWVENAPRVPGEKQCRFCAIKLRCAAKSEHLETLVDDAFDSADEDDPLTYEAGEHRPVSMKRDPSPPPDPHALTTSALAYRLKYRKLYESWFKAIYDELLSRAEQGETIPWFKVATGRNSYGWRDEEVARKSLVAAGLDEDDTIHEEVISPAVAKLSLRKLLHMRPKEVEKTLTELVDVKPGRRQLVPDDDDREDVYEAEDWME